MNLLTKKAKTRNRRKLSIRKSINGIALKPRISISKSNKSVFVQAINDDEQKTLASVKTDKGISNMDKAAETLAKSLLSQKIESAVFDRNGFKYHGNVKAFADGLRKSGIKI